MADSTPISTKASSRAQAAVFRRVNRDILATLQPPGLEWVTRVTVWTG